jgi:hypothetical protein
MLIVLSLSLSLTHTRIRGAASLIYFQYNSRFLVHIMLHKCQFLSSHIALQCTSNSVTIYERILICTYWCVCVCVFCLSCCISLITLHTSDRQQRLTFLLLLEKSPLTTHTVKCLSAEASGSLCLSSLYRLFLFQSEQFSTVHTISAWTQLY